MSELKNCPFCGGDDLRIPRGNDYVVCQTCRAEGPFMTSVDWNTRTPDAERLAEAGHLCTNESLAAGGIEMEGECQVCLEHRTLVACYTGTLCKGCGHMHSTDDLNGLMRRRRNLLGLTRRQIAGLYGVTPKTISNYENIWPSRKYWEWTKGQMKARASV